MSSSDTSSGLFFEFILWLTSIISEIFFREVSVRGSFNLPQKSPCIVVIAPHANQFLDAALVISNVYKHTGRQVHFVEAAVSFRRKVIGLLSTMSGAIPVERAQDLLTVKQGTISFKDYDADPLLIVGEGTKFTEDCMLKGLIGLPNSAGNSPIAEIISDTELKIAKPFKSDRAIKMCQEGTVYKTAPKIDNSEAFKNVFHHLHKRGLIGISPEGGSHDRTELLPLKPGVAIMALGAVAEDPNCEVKIVPCGMNYFHPHKFRSRAVLEFGTPIIVDKRMGERYKENAREVVGELMNVITDAMKSVTVQSPDYETLMTIQAARRLYKNSSKSQKQVPLPLIVEMNRNLLLGYTKYKDEPYIQHLKESVVAYNKKLKYLGIRDHQVETIANNKLNSFFLFTHRLFKLLFILTLSLPGTILFSPVFIATKYISAKKQKAALAGSSVKIRAIDVIGSWKVLVALVFAPALYFIYSLIGTIITIKYELVPNRLSWLNHSLLIFASIWSLLVATTWSAFRIGEVGMDIFKSLKPLILNFTSDSTELHQLKEERRFLATEITDVINRLGPTVIKNYKPLYPRLDEEEEEIDSEYEEIDSEEAHNPLIRLKSSDSVTSGYSEVSETEDENKRKMPNLANIAIFSDVPYSSESSSSGSSDSENVDTFSGKVTAGSNSGPTYSSSISQRVRKSFKSEQS